MAEAGLKIWATELTVDAADEHKKAAALENLLTMFFSHPAVEGVILWHFWDGSNWHQNEALFNGPGITVSLSFGSFYTTNSYEKICEVENCVVENFVYLMLIFIAKCSWSKILRSGSGIMAFSNQA